MARYKAGINGPFSGKVGSVIGASWKGRPYMKSTSSVPLKEPSIGQLNQRMVFGLVSSWLKPMKAWIEIGYRDASESKLPMNAAISFVMKHAMTGMAPDFAIDYPQVVWSRGVLLTSFVTKFEWGEAGQAGTSLLRIEWINALPTFYNRVEDRAVFVLYSVQAMQFAVFDAEAARGDGQAELLLPASFTAQGMHGWMFYTREDMVSTSIYCGEV